MLPLKSWRSTILRLSRFLSFAFLKEACLRRKHSGWSLVEPELAPKTPMAASPMSSPNRVGPLLRPITFGRYNRCTSVYIIIKYDTVHHTWFIYIYKYLTVQCEEGEASPSRMAPALNWSGTRWRGRAHARTIERALASRGHVPSYSPRARARRRRREDRKKKLQKKYEQIR